MAVNGGFMQNEIDLLKESLRALNQAPRFSFDDTDSYKLASKISKFIATDESVSSDDFEKRYSIFKKAFLEVSNGKNFVKIHKVREHLGWSKDNFNMIMHELLKDYKIEVLFGDVKEMSDEDYDNSYRDPIHEVTFINMKLLDL